MELFISAFIVTSASVLGGIFLLNQSGKALIR
jgi:hypothetical protein